MTVLAEVFQEALASFVSSQALWPFAESFGYTAEKIQMPLDMACIQNGRLSKPQSFWDRENQNCRAAPAINHSGSRPENRCSPVLSMASHLCSELYS